jgi:xanthine/uracil/vitamin C permease (AzgA family)
MSWQACKDYTESRPRIQIIRGIPVSYSIADGLALGFISYAVVKALSGRAREIQLAYLPAGHCARSIFRLCAKPNWLT